MKKKLVKSFAYLFTLFLLISVGSCATSKSTPPSANPSGPRTIIVGDQEISEEFAGGFTSWYCKDIIDEEKVVIEVGLYEDSPFDWLGFVLYDGGFTGEPAIYERKGLQHRWDWGPDGNYAFRVKPDGAGVYYDFSSVSSGESTKPSDIYKCYQR